MRVIGVSMKSKHDELGYKIITRAGYEVGHGYVNLKQALVSLKNLRQSGVKDAIVVNSGTVIDRKKLIQKVIRSNPKTKRICDLHHS